MQYRYGYQGQYAERDKETEWNSFELRQYDAVIGRWLSPDPYGQYDSPYVGMGNDWANNVDPDGGFTDPIYGIINGVRVVTMNGITSVALKEVVITATRVGSGALGSGVGNALSAVSGAWNGMSTLDQVQTVVDVAGFIPGVNVVSSLVSAGIDVYKGDYGGAALNLAGIIPGAKAAIVLVTVGTAAVRAAKVLKVAKGATIIKQTSKKTDYLLSNRSDAMNWARNRLGHNTDKMYDASGKWIGWSNSKGSVYWGHGDWGKGVGSSKFPHLNYNIDGKKGHLFLQNKIINRGAWGDFTNHFGI